MRSRLEDKGGKNIIVPDREEPEFNVGTDTRQKSIL